jgi:WD40 repeat protein
MKDKMLFWFGMALGLCSVQAAEVSFEREVWPIFKRHCVGCHCAQKDKGGLRMDEAARLLKGGKTGELLVPGHPDKSLLISQVSGDKPEMPENEPPLSPAKVRVLERWIAEGAKIDGMPKAEVPPVLIPEIYGTAPAVASVALSPDGRTGVVACRSEVVVIDLENEVPHRRLPTEFDLITHLEFSPDGRHLAVSGGSPQQFGGLQILETASWDRHAVRRLGSDTLFRARFSPDGKTIAVGGANGGIHLVPLADKGAPRQIELHSDWVLDVAFTPDGKKLVSGGRDKTTKVCSVEPLQLIRTVDQSKESILAVAANSKHAFSAGTGRSLNGYDFELALSGVELSGGGNDAKPVNKRDQYTRVFEGQPEAVTALAMSGDYKVLAVASRASEVRVYDADTRTKKAALSKVSSPVLAVALNADGSRLLLGAKNGVVEWWDVAQAKKLRTVVPVPVKPAAP